MLGAEALRNFAFMHQGTVWRMDITVDVSGGKTIRLALTLLSFYTSYIQNYCYDLSIQNSY